MPKIDLEQLFAAIDSKDPDRFVSFLTDDAVFRYGSQPAVQGRQAVREYVAGFFGTLTGLSHAVHDTWERNDALVMRGDVTYTKHDGGVITVPFTNIFYLQGDRVQQYLVYADPSPLAG
ncbi:MAG TPA: nuclear transport factor 2 family protein [Gemmatimonadota bacterium]|nr:nuclear transport factor 2 family protein [Gemmatimonadota bacterium]